MIGVDASASDRHTVAEFFELFKTPWEPAVPGRSYGAVVSTTGAIDGLTADLFVVYGSSEYAIDREAGAGVARRSGPVTLDWAGTPIPVYGAVGVQAQPAAEGILNAGSDRVDCWRQGGARAVWRIGYDLFGEVQHLLSEGQPVSEAAYPTLDRHIELLRHLLIASGVPFLEIPPAPDGYDFTCCLTHDVDFFGIRRHRFDRTLAGFALRASVGSLSDWVRGRRSAAEAGRNLAALLSLPLVQLGLRRDFWRPFDDYARVEDGAHSTFFLVPFKNRPGAAPGGGVDATRAVPYEIREIATEALAAVTRGSELAVHGLDAWRDADAGRAELAQLTAVTGQATAGVRMHWLYFDRTSPHQLRDAGYTYDSTWGYNDAVGYRAGTSQVFWLAGAIMELPLSIMDSALFSGRRLALTAAQAAALCEPILAHARRAGGTVVINWHERSLAPERLWGRFYGQLLDAVRSGSRVRFTTAGGAVEWFRWRRSIRFAAAAGAGSVHVTAPASNQTPGTIRVHRRTAQGMRMTESTFHQHATVQLEVLDDRTPRAVQSSSVH